MLSFAVRLYQLENLHCSQAVASITKQRLLCWHDLLFHAQLMSPMLALWSLAQHVDVL